MVKRARPLRGFERDLHLDIKSCKNEYDSVEQLVDHLRSSYRKYGSIKLQPFTERVRNILFHLSNPNVQEVTHSKKKRKKHDGGNEESSSTLTSKLPETDNDGEGSDLMKFMLRKTYIQQGGNNNTDENANNNDKIDDDTLLKGVQEEGGGSGGVDKPMFEDLGGMDELLEELEMDVILPLDYPHLHNHLGVKPTSGILFHGPSGCGKTMLARAIANETGVPFYEVSSTELISGISGASEENIRELFSNAYRTAPSIVFIDEIDAIASKRGNVQKEMEVRVVTQLMKCMEESHRSNSRPGHVLVIGATNNPDAIDPALRRPGRFDLEIKLDIPDENARVQIFSTLTRNLRVEGALDLIKIARTTPGYVGADLVALTKKAGNLALKRIRDTRKRELSRELVDDKDPRKWWRIKPWSPEEMEKLSINMTDFEGATKLVQPSSRREGFSTIPNVKWEDVGGLDSLREEFEDFIVSRIKYPELDMEFGEDIETGFLLYGPSGCGKTLIAKAVANEAGANFIHIEGPEILNKYVGESELAIRTIFTRARACSPCIIFFDEVDALTTKRGKEGGWVVERLLTQLLIELDGGDQRKGVYVIGATNRPEATDRAFLRPGRFGTPIYVPLPSPDERGLILKAIARKRPIDTSVDLMTIGRDDACKNFSGADLSELMRKAARHARRDKFKALAAGFGETSSTIKESHFRRAFDEVSASVSDKQIEYYQRLSKTWRAS